MFESKISAYSHFASSGALRNAYAIALASKKHFLTCSKVISALSGSAPNFDNSFSMSTCSFLRDAILRAYTSSGVSFLRARVSCCSLWEYQAWHSNNPNDTCVQEFTPSLYSDVADYGYSIAGGGNGSVGRGGQCMFFANNILYRSQSDQTTLNFSTMSASADSNLQDVQMGDVLFLYGKSDPGFTTNHVAIVVQIYQESGEVAAVDVIDSNYISDIYNSGVGVPYREVIARHSFCTTADGNCPFSNVQMVQGEYQIWTGTQYYGTSYPSN